MYRKDVNESSPVRILEKSIHGGLGKGNLGVVMARAGVGKTAFLVQVALDDAMRERGVLHVALDQTLEHVHGWYDALFEDLEHSTHLEDPQATRAVVRKHRVIQAFADRKLSSARLEEVVALYDKSMNFKPAVVIIDGYNWEEDVATQTAELKAFKALAKRLDAELWMSAQTHRAQTTAHPNQLTAPVANFSDLVDVAIFLDPRESHVHVRLLKDHDRTDVIDTELTLEADTMRLKTDKAAKGVRLPQGAYMLLSGGAKGTEAYFGEMAEKWGVHESNFSFAGRKMERAVGVVELSDAELKLGDVNEAYIESHLHRKFPNTEAFQKMLQTIWHQVSTASQVFVIGLVQDDNTVRGGTGWAAELAKHFSKPLFVFDQERKAWHKWEGDAFVAQGTPKITAKRFTGTGTRFLSDAGQAAIVELFENSFGPLKKS